MPTTTIEARCNARPTRVAFVLPSPDRKDLLSVISRATSLWGGIFNPVVILDDSTRQMRGRHAEFAPDIPYLESQANLLKAFDPDLVANFSTDPLPPVLNEFQHRTFSAERLDSRPVNNQTSSYFVDVWPLLDDLWEREFKSTATPSLKLGFLEKSEAENSMFLAARYGLYANDDSYEFLRKGFGAEGFKYDTNFRSGMRPDNLLTPSAMTAFHCRQRRQFVHSHAYFLLNPEDPYDVVDYWNLRAAGMILMPITLADYRECEAPIKQFGALAAYPINEQLTNHVVVIKAWSISDEDAEGVAAWMRSLGGASLVGTQGWVPRYNTHNYGAVDEIEITPIMGFEGSVVAVLNDGYGVIKGPVPPFLRQEHFRQFWSMDMSFSTFREQNACYRLPWLNSGCDALVQRSIGFGFDMEAAHVSKSGLVTQHAGPQGDSRLSAITGIDAVKAFLAGKNIEYLNTSSPGLALTRIIEMLGSLLNCHLFQNSAIRGLLEELASGGSKPSREVRGELHRSLQGLNEYGQKATKEQIHARIESLLNQSIDARIFRIGVVFQCSRCKRHNWYAVTEFDEGYNCKSCFARESTPRLDSTNWHYASDGLFRSSNKLDGNITILLALSFFSHLFDNHVYFAPSFEYRLDGEAHEMDFGLLSGGMLNPPEVEMIFGESKSGTALKEEERKKLKRFGQTTGAYLCFCTMALDFDETDKAFFQELYEGNVRVLLINKELLEMSYWDLMKFRSENDPGRSRTTVDWLMRISVIRTLGDDFARKHYIWL